MHERGDFDALNAQIQTVSALDKHQIEAKVHYLSQFLSKSKFVRSYQSNSYTR